MDKKKTKYVASCSFGKDSIATIILAMEHDEPLDEVVYCEVMFDEHTSGEIPEHREFVYEKAIPFLEKHGIAVNIVRSHKNYCGQFMRTVKKDGPSAGKMWSWPLCGKCYVQRDLKVRPMDAWKKRHWDGLDIVQYVGISSDETDRIARLDSYKYHTISLLEKYGLTQADTRSLAESRGLLSPVYQFANRNGCFFCPNAKWQELRHLYDHHRDLWDRMLWLQALPNKATEKFNRDQSFFDIDTAMRLEAAQFDLFGSEPTPFEWDKNYCNSKGGSTMKHNCTCPDWAEYPCGDPRETTETDCENCEYGKPEEE